MPVVCWPTQWKYIKRRLVPINICTSKMTLWKDDCNLQISCSGEMWDSFQQCELQLYQPAATLCSRRCSLILLHDQRIRPGSCIAVRPPPQHTHSYPITDQAACLILKWKVWLHWFSLVCHLNLQSHSRELKLLVVAASGRCEWFTPPRPHWHVSHTLTFT